MTTTIDRNEVERVAAAMAGAQRAALLRTEGDELSMSQSDRGILVGLVTDYSFRPARLTPLGLAVRRYLLEQEQQS